MDSKLDRNFNFDGNLLGATPSWHSGSHNEAYKDPYGINTEMTKDQDEYWAPGRYIPPDVPPQPEHTCEKVEEKPMFDSIINIEEPIGPDQEYSKKIFTCELPIYGKIQFVRDWPGYCYLSFILFYWVYGNWSIYSLILLPHYREGNISLVVLLVYAFISINTIVALFRASTLNPGREIIRGKKQQPPMVDPHNPNQEIRPIEGVNKDYCRKCFQYRPYRAHHCGVCGQCVRRFDHHCPWINNCVGEDNHYAFLQLVFYAFMMSATAFILEMCHWYYLPRFDPEVHLGAFTLSHIRGFTNLAVGMSIGMSCFGGGLASSTAIGVLFDMATVDWRRLEVTVKTQKRFDWDMLPKRQPCLKSYRMFCGPGSVIAYFLACRRKAKVGQAETM